MSEHKKYNKWCVDLNFEMRWLSVLMKCYGNSSTSYNDQRLPITTQNIISNWTISLKVMIWLTRNKVDLCCRKIFLKKTMYETFEEKTNYD